MSDAPVEEVETLNALKRAKLLELKQAEMVRDLPHLNAYPWYEWAWEFFQSRNKINLLCAANQISKSSTQIRKCIEWATNSELWPTLWARRPNQFWYMYPSQKVLEAEFETKWMEFLPRGKMKDHPRYGWSKITKKGELEGIRWNSGIYMPFKLYSQKVGDLQAGSVFALFADEEMPMALYDELMHRMNATDGYFHMVFTATIGQDFWRRALEAGKSEKEELVGAYKRQVSLYDSQKYIDGTPSMWTNARISEIIAKCKTHQEVLRRVFGKFILLQGRKYPTFNASKHMKKAHPWPKDWLIYVGEDSGSGGDNGHPAALCYVAVRPDYKQGRVVGCWRGDGITTDSGAIVRKHQELKAKLKVQPIEQRYDWESKDFFIVAQGMGETFIPANKSHSKGEEIINTLFGNDMMAIYEDEEGAKLATELSTLKKDEPKRHAKDNLADAFRYTVTTIPWDFSGILNAPEVLEKKEEKLSSIQQQCADRRAQMEEDNGKGDWPSIEDEFAELNDLAGG